MLISTWIIVLIAIALIFDFINGFNDSANIAASIISSHSIRPRAALAIAALAGFAGPFIFGVAVAKTIGHDVVAAQFVTIPVLVAALISGCAWSIITSAYGIPSSSSHALIGGLVGAVFISSGLRAMLPHGLLLVGIALLLSPVAGLLLSWIIMKLILLMLKNATPRANYFFKYGQIPLSIALASGNGANDAQKTIGIITLALITAGYQQQFFVPLWVILVCAGAKGLGSLVGGWRVIRKMGTGFYKIKPVHSFTSQLTSSLVVIVASVLGGPVSTTQVVSMSIVGAGAGDRISKVRWMALKDILLSWVLTIPFTAAFAILVYLLLQFLFY